MGIYERDYMRNRRPEENWNRPFRNTNKKKTWIIVVAGILLVVFILTFFNF